jgi:putative oxidoreductase
MKNRIEMGLRILIGIMLAMSGLNKLFGFMPMHEMSEAGSGFMTALSQAKYIIPTIAIIEVFGGILLISNKAVSFALVLLAPIIFNILFFHIFLEPEGVGAGIVFTIVLGWFAWNRKNDFISLFK